MVIIGSPRIAGQTHAGRSVRYQPSAETTAYRELNQNILREKFTPVSNPAEAVAQHIQANSILDPEGLPGLAMMGMERGVKIDSLMPQYPTPQGSDSAYNWLKQRVESGKVLPRTQERTLIGDVDTIVKTPMVLEQPQQKISNFGNPQINGAPNTTQKVNGLFETDVTYANADNFDLAQVQPFLYVANDVSPLKRANVLAHETGHFLAGHSDDLARPVDVVSTGAREAEAETIAYGVMNRLYPWQKKALSNAAGYAVSSQLTNNTPIRVEMLGNQAVNPVAHLRDPEIQDIITNAVQTIVPNPRKPFRNITPQVYGMNTSSTRNLNPLVKAHQQEELMAQAALSDRYARYGY